MCFCDGYSFLIINKNTGEKQFIEGDETLCKFFEGRYSLPHLFHRLLKKEYVRLNDTLYHIVYNSHPECERINMALILFYKNSPYIRITITQQNLHTLNKCHTHNGWNDHTEMKSPITGFQYKT